jgi:hypothetical protein
VPKQNKIQNSATIFYPRENMIYRWLVPKEGGGSVRRYLNFRKQMFAAEWTTHDRDYMPPITLFDFQRSDDALDKWFVSDDTVIGGFSSSKAVLLKTTSCWEKHLQLLANQNQEEEQKKASSSSSASTTIPIESEEEQYLAAPYLRWYGTVDTTVGLESKAQRSGFAALRSPQFPLDGANLKGMYNSVEFTCRGTPHRIFTLNLKISSVVPDDMYQGLIQFSDFQTKNDDDDDDDNDDNGAVPDTDESRRNPIVKSLENRPFETFVLPFEKLRLTAMGRERAIQRKLDSNVKIESVGFVLMDGENGDFEFDLLRIRAVNFDETKQSVNDQPIQPSAAFLEADKLRKESET